MTPAQRLTDDLHGRWHHTYGEARCPAHDDRSPSLSIRDGENAPLLKCHRGCDRLEIIAALRRQGHWQNTVEASSPVAGQAAERRRREEAKTRQFILELWREAQPIAGSLGERYLRNRGISGPLPPSLRCHLGLKHTYTGLVIPALLGAVQNSDRQISGLHRTFLRGDGADKAPVSHPRMMLGKIGGGAVRLAAAAAELAIGEGVETCLSYQRATGIGTWAALSASGIASIVLPPLPLAATVHLLVDLDPTGEEACDRAAARLTREGRRVKLARPTHGKDFNDALREAIDA
jgi:putative DNA primase/helicase